MKVLILSSGKGTRLRHMYLGDNLLGSRIKDVVAKLEELEPHCMIFLKEVAAPRAFGVASLDWVISVRP